MLFLQQFLQTSVENCKTKVVITRMMHYYDNGSKLQIREFDKKWEKYLHKEGGKNVKAIRVRRGLRHSGVLKRLPEFANNSEAFAQSPDFLLDLKNSAITFLLCR